MWSRIDNLINSITMYRLVLYGLVVLAALSLLLSIVGILSVSPIVLILSLVILTASCYISNSVLSRLFKAPVNTESNFITALILFFIISPTGSLTDYVLLSLAGVLAMASKYILAYKKKHIFNPAAFGTFAVGFLGLGASWWIGSEALFIPMLVVGFLVLRKIRKFTLFFSFLAPALVVMLIFGYTYGQPPIETIKFAFTSWPLLFLGTIMLTEPFTLPPSKKQQMIYGAIVGIITTYQLPIFHFYVTPEFALLVGNLFVFFISPKGRLVLTLSKIEKLSQSTNAFIFNKPVGFNYSAGQYMEWTLPHKKSDLRGVRRFFTLASSPTEDNLALGVKKYNPSSTFKNTLFEMKVGDTIYANQLKGDFVLPTDTSQKLVFLAGGIGVTPFRSMVKYLLDKNEKRDIVFIHSCSTADEFTYKDIFEKAKDVGLKTMCVDSSKDQHVTEELIKSQVPEYATRKYYISGSNGMVHGVKKTLGKIGIKPTAIKTDYFAGL